MGKRSFIEDMMKCAIYFLFIYLCAVRTPEVVLHEGHYNTARPPTYAAFQVPLVQSFIGIRAPHETGSSTNAFRKARAAPGTVMKPFAGSKRRSGLKVSLVVSQTVAKFP